MGLSSDTKVQLISYHYEIWRLAGLWRNYIVAALQVEFCSALLCSALLRSVLHPPSPSPDDSTQRRTAATAGGGGAMTLAGARHIIIIIIITIIVASTSDDQVLRGMVYTIAFVCATRETVYSVEYQ
ncbi:predicted protein [Histoplasma capsulatum G186AR]|uniref:Uncharacterized protein n=1 Tax=Ajellomyces capsulatus (strain G186AR / H82 / ATCC MYA-2454 / RMSCC 2432) TaxID=447093 RepID=C0NI14_AJECG|nr:uncharacterized protein HCBG_02986 [Histoplasma capsulatum G186AR]EEH09449.1 predicted protein [Histoplasma capsulatum G186AR]